MQGAAGHGLRPGCAGQPGVGCRLAAHGSPDRRVSSMSTEFVMRPIGVIRTPFTEPRECLSSRPSPRPLGEVEVFRSTWKVCKTWRLSRM